MDFASDVEFLNSYYGVDGNIYFYVAIISYEDEFEYLPTIEERFKSIDEQKMSSYVLKYNKVMKI